MVKKMNRLLIATNNPGKLLEFQALLNDTDLDPVSPAQIGLDLDVTEDGHTYAENAAKKATAFAQASGLISLADDSGLEVDALDGAPGLYSARYGSSHSLPLNSKNLGGAGRGRLSDAERRQYLLSQLQDKPRPWTAHFHATVAIAIPTAHVTLPKGRRDGVSEATLAPVAHLPRAQVPGSAGKSLLSHEGTTHLFEGLCPGELIPEERGAGGFGYDPIFLLTELGKTMAELSMDEKNRLSHRARAVMKAKPILKMLFSQIN